MGVLSVLLFTPCLALTLMTWLVFIGKERRIKNICSYLPILLVIMERLMPALVDVLTTEKGILSLFTALAQGRGLVILSVQPQHLGKMEVIILLIVICDLDFAAKVSSFF